eukprot:1340661-Pleurochrysis_carterae.AAC.2
MTWACCARGCAEACCGATCSTSVFVLRKRLRHDANACTYLVPFESAHANADLHECVEVSSYAHVWRHVESTRVRHCAFARACPGLRMCACAQGHTHVGVEHASDFAHPAGRAVRACACWACWPMQSRARRAATCRDNAGSVLTESPSLSTVTHPVESASRSRLDALSSSRLMSST